jgi:ABC-type Fe3+-hydroxamate transport system substrate-binding protein
MQKNVMIGLVAVIVVAVAAVAVLAMAMGGGGAIPDFQKDTGTVYGNADGNCFIDETDKKVMQKIINKEASLEDYPFADADLDGDVDQDDIAIVDKYIKKESVTLKVLDAEDKVIDIKYPISNVIVLSGSNLAPLINILDITDKIVGAAYTGEKFNEIRDYPIAQGVKNGTIKQISTKGTTADLEIIKDLPDCHFMMTEYSSMYDLDSDDNVKKLNAMGIDVLRMEARDPGQDLRSMAVFGILLNKSNEAKSYQDFMNNIYNQIDSKIGDKKDTHKVLISSAFSKGAILMSGIESGYNAMVKQARGVNAADWTDSTKKVESGAVWHLDPKYAVDLFFAGNTSDYAGSGFSPANVESILTLMKDHKSNTDGKIYAYSTGIPVVCRIAYYAQAMYPDCFEEGWAHNVHQSFIDTFFKTSYTVDDSLYFKQINVDA